MREWTAAARDQFDRYCASVRAKLAGDGADPAEVFDDLRGLVDREAEAAGLQVLTREDVEQILARVGPVGDRPIPEAGPPLPAAAAAAAPLEKRTWFLWACGVALPAVTIAVEATTGWCASTFFDPLPTPAHLLLACLVPATNGWLLRQLGNETLGRPGRMTAASGATMGITLIFAVPFLVLSPIAVIAIPFFGVGLLPLTPPLALVASVQIAQRVRRKTRTKGWMPRPLVLGFAGGIVAFVLADLPKSATNVGLRMAMAQSEATRQRGLRLLRAFGSTDHLLRACYDRSGLSIDLVSFVLRPFFSGGVSPADARMVFYRVTGSGFSTLPPPRVSGLRGGDPTALWDFDQASAFIGAPLKGLSLASSRLDGSVDPDAALAYVEWTLEFKNEGLRPSEARAQVALPPAAVVSRVSLWIDGEEREAAFGGRGQVRQAYERVVQARRDPILVTTSGPDRVLVQCFPVNPGMVMKARMGITAPLLLDGPSRGALLLPRFLDRNFAVRKETLHAVWIETKGHFAVGPAPYSLEPLAAGGQAMRASLSETAVAGEARAVTVIRDPSQVEAWALPEGGAPAIRQTLRRRAPAPMRRLVVVLDGSRGASAAGPVLAAALPQLPAGLEVAVVLASDTATVIAPLKTGGDAASLAVAKVAFAGGADNVPALAQAWDLAAGSSAGIVLWVHGPQPMRIGGATALEQRWARRPTGPRLLALPVTEGPNQVFEELGHLTSISSWPRRGPLAADLEEALGQVVGSIYPIEALREVSTSPPKLVTLPTSGHIRRLWAAAQVHTALATGDVASRKAAVDIAVKNRVVTPVSGAVVLETQVQYQGAGLEPPGQQSIPTIPEPDTWLLLIVVACALAWLLCRRPRERIA
jgi:Vault protein inter-alpha-trypsin domain